MKRISFLLLLSCVVVCAQQSTDRPKLVDLFTGEQWIGHMQNDLLPFWTMPGATGDTLGAFPSLRYNDGTIIRAGEKPRNELGKNTGYNAWIFECIGCRSVVSQSRQTYLYGVAYHLTGDAKMLELAHAGSRYLIEHFQDPEGGFYATLCGSEGVPPMQFRTAQEMGYSLLGLSFYYYLTRDPEVLAVITKAKDFYFSHFGSDFDSSWTYLRWNSSGRAKRYKSLIAQLDQLNTYMMLMTPLLEKPAEDQWKADLHKLAYIIKDQFYSPEYNVFWMRLQRKNRIGPFESDFGHSIKAFWFLYQTGIYTNDTLLVSFALKNGKKLLSEAFLARDSAWAMAKIDQGKVDKARDWWMHAELDQFAATMSLSDPAMLSYLTKTNRFWINHFVDHKSFEVWPSLDTLNRPRPDIPKAHFWKNGYHTFEHTLVGYITAQAIRKEPVTLYYAFKTMPDSTHIQPYFFKGEIDSIAATDRKCLVKFVNVKP